MTEFTVDAGRVDPYENFRFRVRWDGRHVAGVSRVGGLERTTQVVKHREGGDPSWSPNSPGRTEYAITLERGITHDLEFQQWATKVWHLSGGPGGEASLKDVRKDLTIEFYDEAGRLALAYRIYRAWVSEYVALPDLDANANTVAIESITLEHEGFERDASVPEPAEPSFTDPSGD
jgi:phage tail-like protein